MGRVYPLPRAMQKARFICFAVLALSCLASVAQEKRAPSTADERKRFVAVTRDVIRAPLDKSKSADVKWALQWLGDVPDVNVDPCPLPLEDLTTSGHPYSPKIFGAYVMSMGVYAIEHLGKPNDPAPQFLAGVEGALRAYQAILRAEPDAASEDLEDLLLKQRSGELREFVQRAAAACAALNEAPKGGSS